MKYNIFIVLLAVMWVIFSICLIIRLEKTYAPPVINSKVQEKGDKDADSREHNTGRP